MKPALLCYLVGVTLLAWWPWNFWLLLGAAWYWNASARKRDRLHLTTAHAGRGGISGAEGVHQ